MKNVTITLEEEVARWARIWAARHERSLSRMVADLLRSHMEADEGYEAAMKSFLNRPPKRLKKRGTYPARDELHERHLLR